MKKIILSLLQLFISSSLLAQGYNHTFLLGYGNNPDSNCVSNMSKSRLNFSSTSVTIIPETRKMAFSSAQANISDDNGNLIAATNGCWIMDATGDTMQNGSGLNPGLYADSYCSSTSGIPYSHADLFIPFPGDSNKFVLFHQTGDFDAPASLPSRLYYSIIDKTLNGGLGGVISAQKNLIAFQDTLSAGIAACKHANGRDWWIVGIKDGTNFIYKILFTNTGISSISTQQVNMPLPIYPNAGQPCFSPDGTKFAYTYGKPANPLFQDVRIFSFDRCTGNLDSLGYIYKSGQDGFGLCFSSNSRYLYYSSFGQVFQLDTDAPNISASDTLVATYDGYWFPVPALYTDFWLMYRAANGKIYITSSNFVLDLHVMNSPDSSGIACDLQQHSLHIPCYAGYGNVNHPNYYLGCDTTLGCPCLDNTGITEQSGHHFKFRVYPNPLVNQNLNIGYLLPQNKSGTFLIYDVTGKVVFTYVLPPWSNEQSLRLPELSDGVYNCVITSGNERVSKKIAVIHE